MEFEMHKTFHLSASLLFAGAPLSEGALAGGSGTLRNLVALRQEEETLTLGGFCGTDDFDPWVIFDRYASEFWP
jgi:hypothetical protein